MSSTFPPRDRTLLPVISGPQLRPGALPSPQVCAFAAGWLVYLMMMVWLMGRHGDFAIADRLYAWQGSTWMLREHWLTGSWIHVGGKRLSLALWLVLAGMLVAMWKRPAWRAWRRPLLILLASVLLSTVVVALIKRYVPMFCPWSLQRYGGTAPFIGLFDAWPAGVRRNACFPAAHASTGFAWIALYFFFLQVRPRWRWWGLAFGMSMGALFALAQELRGAHFLSHDLTTIMVCWGVSLLLYAGFKGKMLV